MELGEELGPFGGETELGGRGLPAEPLLTRVWRAAKLGALGLWMAGLVILGASLMAAHLLALPVPLSSDLALAGAMAADRDPSDTTSLQVLHVLYSECTCSQNIWQRLRGRSARKGVREKFLFVGDEGADPASMGNLSAGKSVEWLTPSQLQLRYHLEAAPVMVVADASGKVVYVGGYTERKQSADIQADAIVSRLLGGESVAPLPLFGCAVSSRLKKAQNPIGVKE